MFKYYFLIASFFLCSLHAEEENHEIAIEIKIQCPNSEAYEAFLESIPERGTYSSTYEEWKSSFKKNMHALIDLLETDQVNDSFFSVHVDRESE